MSTPRPIFDAAVVGTGPAGLTAALALGAAGLKTAIVGPAQPKTGRMEDRRTAALFAGSIELLRNLGIWQHCADACTPLVGIRMIDGRKALLRAPDVLFHASDVDLDAFGYNVPNHALTTALWATVRDRAPDVTAIATDAVEAVDLSGNRSGPTAKLSLADGSTVEAHLIVGADGRKSMCRAAAGISVKSWTYPQAAVACTFDHTRHHNNISTEFHHTSGPLTVVPMPGNASSLVWVTTPEEADHLRALEPDAFAATLEQNLHGLLGTISDVAERAVFPLSAAIAEHSAANSVALVGEAAHVIPPIGAQGLNLGLRDCAELAECMKEMGNAGDHQARADCLARYDKRRRFDIRSRTGAVDIFNRSLLTSFLPAHLARGAGLHVLKSVPFLRRWVIQEGLSPSGVTPTLMRPSGHF